MFWILMVMALFVSIAIALLVGGLATPRKYTAARSLTLRAAPDVVWKLVRTVMEYPNWRDEIQSVDIATDGDNRTTWTEMGRQKLVSYAAILDEPPHRFTARIIDDDLGYSGEWQYVVVATNGGTRLTITEQGEVGNPISRFFRTHLLGHTRGIDAFLRDVAVQLGEQAKPDTVRQ